MEQESYSFDDLREASDRSLIEMITKRGRRARKRSKRPKRPKVAKKWSPRDDDFVNAPWYECPGTLNDIITVNALPDWGSSVDAMSENFAKKK